MNELIKQLAEESGAGWDNKYHWYVGHEQMKQFAELIVRECAKFLDENSGYDDANNAWHPEPEDLLKHFGMKE